MGRDYALVIEALSSDNPPRFLGSSCNYLPEVNAGRNEPVLAAPIDPHATGPATPPSTPERPSATGLRRSRCVAVT